MDIYQYRKMYGREMIVRAITVFLCSKMSTIEMSISCHVFALEQYEFWYGWIYINFNFNLELSMWTVLCIMFHKLAYNVVYLLKSMYDLK